MLWNICQLAKMPTLYTWWVKVNVSSKTSGTMEECRNLHQNHHQFIFNLHHPFPPALFAFSPSPNPITFLSNPITFWEEKDLDPHVQRKLQIEEGPKGYWTQSYSHSSNRRVTRQQNGQCFGTPPLSTYLLTRRGTPRTTRGVSLQG